MFSLCLIYLGFGREQASKLEMPNRPRKEKRLPQKPALPSQGPEKGPSNKNRTLSDENSSSCSQTPRRSCGSHPTTARRGQTGAGMSALIPGVKQMLSVQCEYKTLPGWCERGCIGTSEFTPARGHELLHRVSRDHTGRLCVTPSPP